MPHKLDELIQYETFDKQDLGFDVEHIPEQILRAKKEMESWKIPAAYKKCTHIILAGMGGSHLPMQLLKSLIQKEGRKSIEIISDYEIPAYTNSKTLVILASYSGTTEEIVEAAKSAKQKKAKIIAVTTGGELAKKATREKWPMYQYAPGEVVRAPQLAIGFTLAAYLHILKEVQAITYTKAQFASGIDAMIDVIDSCAIAIEEQENPAKQMAKAIEGAPILIVAAEHLAGNAILLKHQMEELAKTHTRVEIIPELNHHFLESLEKPEGMQEGWSVIMLESEKYRKETQKRFTLTADMLEKEGAHIVEYKAHGATRLEEMLEVMQFGSYAAFFTGVLAGIEMGTMPRVQEFKKKLVK